MEEGPHQKLFIKKEVNVIRQKIKKDFQINLMKAMLIQKNHQKKQFKQCIKYKELKEFNHKKKWKINRILMLIQEMDIVIQLQLMNKQKKQKTKNQF